MIMIEKQWISELGTLGPRIQILCFIFCLVMFDLGYSIELKDSGKHNFFLDWPTDWAQFMGL